MLIVHRAEGTAALADALGQVLTERPLDPFTPDVIAVPAKGVERWLTQRLSTVLGTTSGDGIAANIEFPSPTRLVDEAVAAATGLDPDVDPWGTGRLVWTLLAVIDECLDQPWCTVLRAHLTGPEREGRRYATAEHLTQLFRSYSAQRPQEVDHWFVGADDEVPEDLRWQVELWRRVAARIGEPPPPASRLLVAAATLRDQPSRSRLPQRLSLFGPTRLTTEQLDVQD
ncbi:MAG: recC, partial [Frankiales bacterium]|nr:recC [Frankiales bacterium]